MELHGDAPAPALAVDTAAPASTRLRIVADVRELDGLSQRWNQLAADGTPMEHFAWTRAAAEVFAGDRLRVFAVERDGRACALAPFVASGAILPRLEALGSHETGEPFEPIHEDPAALRELLVALVGAGTPVYAERVFADSPVLAALREACGARAMVITRPAVGCPRIVLDETWREPERNLSVSRAADLRRKQRFAERTGAVTLEAITPTPEQLDPLLEEAFRVEAAGWKGENGSALSRKPRLGTFYRSYAAAACARGILRVFFMRIAGRAVATVIALECADALWTLKIGYDEAFGRCSPGALLTRYTIAYAAERGLRSYEFLGTAAAWTTHWTQDVRPCVSLRIYPLRPSGLAAFAVDLLDWSRARLLKRVGRAFRGRTSAGTQAA